MRLRLRIERNALPPTQALWPIKDKKSTIAQLLEQINKIFPLEADTWGLEDYSVSVGGYDCLHYHELDAVCRDEDEVVIRPLQYIDVRSRTLNGRNQISADGRHLVDGVPFGKPALRDPVRPDVSIPPRKKRKLSGEVEGGDESREMLMLTENREQLGDDEDEDDDEEYDWSATDESSSESSSPAEDGSSGGSGDSSTDEQSSQSDSEYSDDESDAPESWAGIPNSEPPTPSRKGEKPADSSSARQEQTSRPSDSNQSGTKRKRGLEHEQETPVESKHDLRATRRNEAAAEHAHETQQPRAKPEPTRLPFEGSAVTKARNARRRDAKTLSHLKSIGELPEDATLEMARQHQMTNGVRVGARAKQISTPVVPAAVPSDQGILRDLKRTDPVENEVDGVVNAEIGKAHSINLDGTTEEPSDQLSQDIVTASKKRKRSKQADPSARTADELEKKRQKLLSAIASGGIDVDSSLDDVDDEPPIQMSSKEQLPPMPIFGGDEIPGRIPSKAAVMLANPATPRSKLDLAGSKRLVFGSLGVRVPKTQEDKDALQKKLAERPSRNVQHEQADVSEANGILAGDGHEPDVEHVEGNESWRDKIRLTAVECCDTGVTLSAPPFPFHQRWDRQYRKQKEKGRNRTNGKYMEKKGTRRGDYVESYDKYNINGGALDYDDPEEDDEYWEDGALLDGGYEDEDEDEEEDSTCDDGFPSPPSNPDELPILTEDEATAGDFITFTELACDESTNWQPRTVTRIALICSLPNPDSEVKSYTIQLSLRDMPTKVYDDEGNRIYSKFEMPGIDADDEGKLERQWNELGVVRLVSRPE